MQSEKDGLKNKWTNRHQGISFFLFLGGGIIENLNLLIKGDNFKSYRVVCWILFCLRKK